MEEDLEEDLEVSQASDLKLWMMLDFVDRGSAF